MGGHQRGEKGCGPEIALEGRREGGARGGSTGAWEGRDADPQEGPLGGVQGWEALEGPVPGRGGGAGRGQSSQSDLGLGRSNLAEAGRVRSEWRGWEALGKAVEGPTPGKRRRWPGEGGGEWTALEMAGIYAGEGRAAGWKRGGGSSWRGAGLGGCTGSSAGTYTRKGEGARSGETRAEALQGPTPERGGTRVERGSSRRGAGLGGSRRGSRGTNSGGWGAEGGLGQRGRNGHIYLQTLGPPPRSTEAGRGSTRTQLGFLDSDCLTFTSGPLSNATPPRRACARPRGACLE